jgi:RNA polymerase sigma-70 factor (ECF subfamily)
MASEQRTDEELIRSCRDGDRDSFSVLVDRYKDLAYTVAFRMSGDADTAKDVAQDAFVAAYHGIHLFRFGAKFSTWLYTIVLNKCRDQFRQARPALSTDDIAGTYADRRPSPEQTASSHQDRDLLQQALDRLPAEYREVLVLKHIEDLDYQEIASITGDGVPALKVRAHRGREMLRKALEEAGVCHG